MPRADFDHWDLTQSASQRDELRGYSHPTFATGGQARPPPHDSLTTSSVFRSIFYCRPNSGDAGEKEYFEDPAQVLIPLERGGGR